MPRPTTLPPRRDLRRRLGLLAGMGVVALALIAGHGIARPAGGGQAAVADLTVVELFTSQGCNACPPANANLLALSERPDVLTLSWNVTYWDGLGWKDTFAQEAFTRRQRDYQRGLGNENVWTPQVIVDGRADVVGRRMSQIQGLIDGHRPFTGPAVVVRNGAVGLAGGAPPTRPADVWLVRYEPRPRDVPVARGENGGRTLPHASVVRELIRIGAWQGATVGYRLPAPTRSGLATAILVQGPGGGPILAAARG